MLQNTISKEAGQDTHAGAAPLRYAVRTWQWGANRAISLRSISGAGKKTIYLRGIDALQVNFTKKEKKTAALENRLYYKVA